jgi:hypothetical protein
VTDADLSSLLPGAEETKSEPEPEMAEAPIEVPDVLTGRSLGGLQIMHVDEQMPNINMLVYGPPGVGKTVLAGSASDVEEMSPVLLIDVEGGSFSLRAQYPQVEVVRIQSWSDMIKLYNDLYDGVHPYKTLILDSLTEIQKFSMLQIMKELIAREADRDPDVPGMREWGKNIEQIRRLVRAFRDLPYNVIMTALVVEDKDARSGVLHKKPSLSGKLSAEVAGFLDIVTYYYTKMVAVEGGDPEKHRLLLTQQTEDTIAKDRSDRLPMVIVDPTMRTIYNHIFSA